MGDMLDFEVEWGMFDATPTNRKKKSAKKEITVTLTKAQYEKYKQLGGATWLKKMIASSEESR